MCGKAPSSQPTMKTVSYSSPFALWRVISVTLSPPRRSSASCSEQSEFCCRYSSSGVDLAVALELALAVELGGDPDQRLEVLGPPFGLDRPLRRQRFQVAGLVQHPLQQLERIEAPSTRAFSASIIS